MIAKLETGNGFKGALRYDVRAGKGTAKELARVLDAYGVSYDFDDKGNLLINPKQVGFDFRQQTMGYTGEGVIRKPVYHWVLSYSPKDNVSEEQMQKDAKEFLKRIGFDDTQYVMTVHYDKEHHHLHIVTNIVNNQGKRIPTMGLIDKAHAAAAAITKENGYTWGEKTKKENITQERMHKPHERARETIEPMIREALAASTSLHDFQEKLIMDYGIMCNYTVAKDGNRGRMSYCYEYEGQYHSFKASDVAKDLSFGYVNQEIKKNYKRDQDEVWREYNAMRPVLTHANEIVTDLFNARKDQKQELQKVNSSLSGLYAERNRLWELYKESKRENYNDYKARRFVAGLLDGGPLMLPLFVLALTVKIIVDLTRDDSILYAWSGCKDKIEDLNKEIDELKIRKFDILHEIKGNSEQIKDSIQFRDEIKANMVEIKSNIVERQKEAEARAAKPKVTLSSLQKAFGQMQKTTTATTTDYGHTVSYIRTGISESNTIQELNLKLLAKDIHLAPVKNASGLVSDLKITQGGKDVMLSTITGTLKALEIVSSWGDLSHMPTAQPRQAVDNRSYAEKTGIIRQGGGLHDSFRDVLGTQIDAPDPEEHKPSNGPKFHR